MLRPHGTPPVSLKALLRGILKGTGNRAQFARGAGGGLVVQGAAAALTFVMAVVMTNVMGAVAYGLYAFVVGWLTFLVMFGRSGYNRSAVRFVAVYRGQQRWDLLRGFLRYSRTRVLLASGALALVAAAGLTLFRAPLEATHGPGLVATGLLAAAVLVGLALLQLQIGFLEGLRRVVQAQVPLQIVRPLLITLALLGLARWSPLAPTAPTAMAVTLAATLVVLVLSYILLARAVPPETRQAEPAYEKQAWKRTSRDMMLATGFNLVLLQADILMLGMLVDTTQAGIYHVASKVVGLLSVAHVAVSSMLQPIAADLFARNRQAELQRFLSLGASLIFGIGLVCGAVLFVGAEPILGLFGPAYLEAALPLRVLLAGTLLNLLTGPGLLLLHMTGHQRDGTVILGAAAVLNIVLNAALIPFWGTAGAAIATATSLVLWNAAAALAVWVRLKLVSVAFFPTKEKP